MLKNLFRKKNKKEPNVKFEVDNSELDEDLKIIAEYMLKKEKRTPDAVNLSIYNRERFDRWNRNSDIKKEFAFFVKNGKYPDKPVEVCGWTAKKLFEEYKGQLKWVSECYIILMCLREDPEKWLEVIRKGFPIK